MIKNLTSILSFGTRHKIIDLSQTTTDSKVSGQKMLEAAKLNIKMTKAAHKVDLLKNLRQRKIGTPAIEKACKLVTEGDRDEKVVVEILGVAINLADSRKHSTKMNCFKGMREAEKVLPAGWRVNIFRRIVHEECEFVWNVKKEKARKKLDHLEKKVKGRRIQNLRVEGVRISNEDLYEEFGIEEEDEAMAYGVDLDENEKAFLKLPKCMADFPKLEKEQMYTDIHVAAAKVRLDFKQKQNNDGEDLTEKENNEEIKSRMVFDLETKELDFSNRRVTDMKTCRRVYVPGPMNKHENKLQLLVGQLENAVDLECERMNSFPRDGESKSVYSVQQQAGRKSLLGRQNEGELVLLESDKSGNVVAVSTELFMKKMEPHIKDDEVVEMKEVREKESLMNATALQFSRVLNMGVGLDQEDRVKEAVTSANAKIPVLKQMIKVHKSEVAPGEGGPTRPVGAATEAPNGTLTEIGSDFLKPFNDELDRVFRTEARSTEEVQSEVEQLNQRLDVNGMKSSIFQTDGSLQCGSLDFEAFFPSVDVDFAADKIEETVVQSDIDVKVDTEALALFIACSNNQEEITARGLEHVVHKRRYTGSTRPGMKCAGVTGGPKARAESDSWLPPRRKPGCRQLKRMLGMAIKYIVKMVMKNHFYMV